MRVRIPVPAIVAMAFLACRLLGLHFHVEEHNYLPDHEVVAHVESETGGNHLDDHLLNGDQDIESSAIPTGHPSIVAAPLILAFLILAALTTLRCFHLRVGRPAFRPPRLRQRTYLLPPSQGPPQTV